MSLKKAQQFVAGAVSDALLTGGVEIFSNRPEGATRALAVLAVTAALMNSGPAFAQSTHAGRVIVNDAADGVLDFERAGRSVERIQDAISDGNVYRALRETGSILRRAGKYENAARKGMAEAPDYPVSKPAPARPGPSTQGPAPGQGGGTAYQSPSDFRKDFGLQ